MKPYDLINQHHPKIPLKSWLGGHNWAFVLSCLASTFSQNTKVKQGLTVATETQEKYSGFTVMLNTGKIMSLVQIT